MSLFSDIFLDQLFINQDIVPVLVCELILTAFCPKRTSQACLDYGDFYKIAQSAEKCPVNEKIHSVLTKLQEKVSSGPNNNQWSTIPAHSLCVQLYLNF